MPNLYDKDGNLHVVDSADQAAQMVQSGQFAFDPSAPVQIVEQGEVKNINAQDAPAALASGMQLAGSEDVRHANVQETYGGAGGAIASMGFHGLDALGLNAATEALIQSKAKLHGVDPNVIREEIMGLREANPIASGIGTGLGLVAPSLFTGGAALAEEGGALTKGLYGAGKVLTAPGRAIGALGEGVGGAVGGLLGDEGAGFLSKLATRSATLGASGAAELGAYGGAATVGEASLGDDHELTAEKFWSGVGNGALAGLLGGAGLGAISASGSAIKGAAKDMLEGVRMRGKDVEALAERTFGESADGLGSAYSKATAGGTKEAGGTLKEAAAGEQAAGAMSPRSTYDKVAAGIEGRAGIMGKYADTAAAIGGKDADAIRDLTRLNAEGRAARRMAVFEGDATRAESARELRTNIDQMNQATKNLSPEWREAKAANVAKTIAKTPEAFNRQAEIAIGSLTDTSSKLQEMLADPAAYGDRGTLGKLQRHIEVASREVATALEAGRGEDAFVALDNLKRKMGPLAKPGRMLSVAADQEASREVRTLYDNLRGTLTDEAWGKAGVMQKDVNAAYEKWLSTKDLFDQRFTTQTGREGWERTFGADPVKIDAYVNGLTSPKNDLTHNIIKQHIESTKALATELSKAGELTPEKAAELAHITRGAEAFEKTVKKAEKALTLTNQLRELERADHGAGAGLLGAAGGMLGGPLGALAGGAIGVLSNPARMVRQLAAVERIAAKVDAKMGAGVKAFVHGEAVTAPAKAAKAGNVAQRFEQESRAVRTFAQNPTLATDRIGKSFAGVQAAAPSVASQLAFKATRAAQALSSMLPESPSSGGLFQHLDKPRYSDAEMQRWLRAKEVIENPVDTLLTGMSNDHVSPIDVDLVKEHSPKVYEQFVNMATAELANVKSPPSYQRRVQIGILLGVPADRTMDPAFLQMSQAAYAAQSQPQQPPPPSGGSGHGASPAAQHGATASEAVEGR